MVVPALSSTWYNYGGSPISEDIQDIENMTIFVKIFEDVKTWYWKKLRVHKFEWLNSFFDSYKKYYKTFKYWDGKMENI